MSIRTHTAMLPRDTITSLLASHDELVALVESNVLKRMPKRQSSKVTERARAARAAVIQALKDDDR